MALNQYIGARYVPLITGEWDSATIYEPLSVVLYQGSSYTSICSVPIGIPPTNTAFWALTGNYNAQVEEYRQQVAQVTSELNKTKLDIVNVISLGCDSTGVNDCSSIINNYITNNSGEVLYFPKGTYLLQNTINLLSCHIIADGNLKYTGNNSAILITESGSEVTFNDIDSANIGIEIYGNQKIIDYVKIKGVTITAITGVYMHTNTNGGIQYCDFNITAIICDKTNSNTKSYFLDSTLGGYLGENRIHSTKVSGYYGIYCDGAGGNLQGLRCDNVSIEGDTHGVKNGVYLKNTSFSTFINLRGQEPDASGKQIILVGNTFGNQFITDVLYIQFIDSSGLSGISPANIIIGTIYNNTTSYQTVLSGLIYIRGANVITGKSDFGQQLNMYPASVSEGAILMNNNFYTTFLLDPAKTLTLNSRFFLSGFRVIVILQNGGTIIDETGATVVNTASYVNKAISIERIFNRGTITYNKWIITDLGSHN